MYIGIDGNEANTVTRVGVNQYAYELLWALYKRSAAEKENDDYVIYLKSNPLKQLPPENPHWKYKIISGKSLWVLTKLMPAIMFDKKLDVFFTPHHYLPIFSSAPKVMAVHDLGYLKFSEQFKKSDFWQLKYWTAISIYVSKYIITFSTFTKEEIVRRYKIDPQKVFVVPHGYDNERFNTNINRDVVRRIQKKYGTGDKYLLFLGTLKPSKNIEGIIEAFSLIRHKYPDYRLVIAGKKGWLYESIFEKVITLKLQQKVVFTDFVDEEDKPALIAGSKMFLLPSFWEGFGMDILTSFACGVPVVGSKVASIPEVAGDLLFSCDPDLPGTISDGIERVLRMSSKEYNDLSIACVRWAKRFSWEKTAHLTLNALKKAAK